MNQPGFTINLDQGKLQAVLLLTGALLVFWGAFIFSGAVRSVITLFICSLLLTLVLLPVVTFFEQRGLDRLRTAAIIIVGLLLLSLLFTFFMSPILSRQIQELSIINEATSGGVAERFQRGLGMEIPIMGSELIQSRLELSVNDFLAKSISAFVVGLSSFASMTIIMVMTFFTIRDGSRIRKEFLGLVPNRYFEMTVMLLHKTSHRVGRYMRNELPFALLVGTLSVAALYLLDVRFYLLLGILAGFANMIPFFGSFAGVLPAIFVVVTEGNWPGGAIVVTVAFATIEIIKNLLITLFRFQRTENLGPLTTIIVVLIGGQLMGFPGALASTPVAIMTKIAVSELITVFRSYRIFAPQVV